MGFDGNAGFSQPITGNEGALTIPAITSDGYVAGSEGWSIQANGDAEFNDVTIRNSTIVGGPSFWYLNGVPGANRLIVSVAAEGGTDPYGNHYAPGILIWDGNGNVIGEMTSSGNFLQLADIVGFVSAYSMISTDPANTPEYWHSVTYQNGYADFGTSGGIAHQPVRYRVAPDGFTILDGDAKPGTWANGTAIFTVPASYAPVMSRSHIKQSANIAGGTYSIDVLASGVVQVNDIQGAAPAIIDLSNIRWPSFGSGLG